MALTLALTPSPTLSPSKVGYARGVAARWGVSHAARFVCASAEATVAHVAAGDAAAPLLGVMVQFPSPFRVDSASTDGEGGGNGQLPSGADDPSYMLSLSPNPSPKPNPNPYPNPNPNPNPNPKVRTTRAIC